MKWGRRKNVNPKPHKKPFDKKQFKEDFKVERRLGLSREDARLTAKRTQKDGKKASPGWTLEEKQLIPR